MGKNTGLFNFVTLGERVSLKVNGLTMIQLGLKLIQLKKRELVLIQTKTTVFSLLLTKIFGRSSTVFQLPKSMIMLLMSTDHTKTLNFGDVTLLLLLKKPVIIHFKLTKFLEDHILIKFNTNTNILMLMLTSEFGRMDMSQR